MSHSQYSETQYLCFHQGFVTTFQSLFYLPMLIALSLWPVCFSLTDLVFVSEETLRNNLGKLLRYFVQDYLKKLIIMCNNEYHIQSHRRQILTTVPENCEKTDVKYSLTKLFLLNFVNLAIKFRPWLSNKANFYVQHGVNVLEFTFSVKFGIWKNSFALKLIFRTTEMQERPEFVLD